MNTQKHDPAAVAVPHPSSGSAISWIRQKDSHGCLVACLAMVTGHDYDRVRAYFEAADKEFVGERGGITEFCVADYLGDHGFAYVRKYCWIVGNRKRPVWPMPPFAPAHILGVNGCGRHGVVMTGDGAILDPLHDAPRRISDYPEVGYMIGVWAVSLNDKSTEPLAKGE